MARHNAPLTDVRDIFVPADDGKMRLLDNSYWETAGGTRHYADLQGAGTLHINCASKPIADSSSTAS